MQFNRRELLATTGLLSLAQATWATEPKEPVVTRVSEVNIMELRQYTLRGGQRDVLVSMFEQKFLDPQNALGAHIIGTFRDLDDPDRFVWMRGFRDMPARQAALTAFYGGPVWAASRAEANATMIDSGNVLLLHPAGPGLGFPASPPQEAPARGGLISASIYYLGPVGAGEFASVFAQSILPHLVSLGAQPIAQLVTEETPNNFPRLPIREGERTFIWFARWHDEAAEEDFSRKLRQLSGWRDSVPETVLPALMRKPERLRLAPTLRSELR